MNERTDEKNLWQMKKNSTRQWLQWWGVLPWQPSTAAQYRSIINNNQQRSIVAPQILVYLALAATDPPLSTRSTLQDEPRDTPAKPIDHVYQNKRLFLLKGAHYDSSKLISNRHIAQTRKSRDCIASSEFHFSGLRDTSTGQGHSVSLINNKHTLFERYKQKIPLETASLEEEEEEKE